MGCSPSSARSKECENYKALRTSNNTKMEKSEVMKAVIEEVSNDFTSDMALPELSTPTQRAPFSCLYGYGKGKWPIRNYAPLDTCVNAYHGGCAGLLLCSNTYGGEGAETTLETFLYRGGFSGNHFSTVSLVKGNYGHFGADNAFETDENGRLIGNLAFGTNLVSLLSNHPQHGNLSHGVWVRSEDDEKLTVLPLDVNGENGGGNTLLLCSAVERGPTEATLRAAIYAVRSGWTDNYQETKLLHGDDLWTFDVGEVYDVNDELLRVTGPEYSTYGLYHNSDGKIDATSGGGNGEARIGSSRAGHAATVNGQQEVKVTFVGSQPGVIVLLCSNSSLEAEDGTCAAVYLLGVSPGEGVTTKYISGSLGTSCPHGSADLWQFHVTEGVVIAQGPMGPCRYGFVSNMPTGDNDPELSNPCSPFSCLITGRKEALHGTVQVEDGSVIGWVNTRCDIKICVNKQDKLLIKSSDLQEVSDRRFAFCHTWEKEELKCGIHLVSVKGKVDDEGGRDHWIEIAGSPRQVVQQYPGVVYALNCGGPAYRANNGIVYTSEFSQYASFTYDLNSGTRCKAGGSKLLVAQIPQLITATDDGFLFTTGRSVHIEPLDEQHIDYRLPNIPNGQYKLLIHTTERYPKSFSMNGVQVVSEVNRQIEEQKVITPGKTAFTVTLSVKVSDGTLRLTGKQSQGSNLSLCAFALLTTAFKPVVKSKEELEAETKLKVQFADKLDPLVRTMTRKERKLVGWSPNLLQNASGEADDLSCWNVRGDWKIHPGGHGTEKAFVTSHMWCVKHQDVDLTGHFSQQYLDTAPDIQVSEWYREGVCGGGHYAFTATLRNGHGQEIARHNLPETDRLYRGNAWTEEKVTFKGYGPGVTTVTLESKGKDDKHWGGHYGPIMSSAIVRVKSETSPAKDDLFVDVIESTSGNDTKRQAEREQLIAKVLQDNRDLLRQLVDESVSGIPGAQAGPLRQGPGGRRPPAHRKQREVRVFVSSTFRDFRQEREELIKKTFREVNAMCVERGVFFTYVDLRWGITEDQTKGGQTISICLQEIDRCRPYFICMMGDRYGWCQKPGSVDDTLSASFDYVIENQPRLAWVDAHREGASVTKLEVLHGVLNDVENRKDRSFFYLRSPVQPEDWPASQYSSLASESDWHRQAQYNLRHLVEENHNLKRRTYDSRRPLEVCEKIKQDLEWCVDQDFPLGTELTALEREREAHIAFADARCRVYIGREEYFNKIQTFMDRDVDTPLVILGESGSGKSALVANWVRRIEEKLPNTFIFVHFIGSSAESSSHLKLLRRLYEEMREFFSFDLAIPQSDTQLVRDFPAWLRLAGSVSQCYLVFDAVNQLDTPGSEGAEQDLLWIPQTLPAGVRLLISTLPGRAFEAVKVSGWPTMEVHPLNPSEKMQIVTEYLENIYGKTLSVDQKNVIVDANQTNNALYLKALLDEVRMFGNFRQLTSKIEDYLLAPTPPDLFAKILTRFETDFEGGQYPRPGLVRESTSAVWCSNKGMSEAEILQLLKVPSAVWSPFYLSVVDNLVNRNGIVNFFHDHLRQAVEAKYLPTPTDKTTGYLWLADFFCRRPVDDRVAEELPFLLAKAGELERLKDALSDIEIFRRLIKTEEGKFDLIKYWKMLGDFSQVEDAYLGKLAAVPDGSLTPEVRARLKQDLAEFFTDLGLYDAARTMLESLLKSLEEMYRHSHSGIIYTPFNFSEKYMCKHPSVIDILHKLGTVCEKQKNFDQALVYYRDALYRQNDLNGPEQKLQVVEGLLGQATVLYLQDNMNNAKDFLVRARELATDILGQRHHYVAAIINKLGQLVYKQGRVDEAIGYFLLDLSLTRADVGTAHPRVASTLNDIALVYDDRNDATAGRLYEAALIVLLELYGQNHLDVAVVRYNLGAFYFAMNAFARSRYQFTEACRVYEMFLGPDHPDTVEARAALTDVVGFT